MERGDEEGGMNVRDESIMAYGGAEPVLQESAESLKLARLCLYAS
jgi:hypothetical protein